MSGQRAALISLLVAGTAVAGSASGCARVHNSPDDSSPGLRDPGTQGKSSSRTKDAPKGGSGAPIAGAGAIATDSANAPPPPGRDRSAAGSAAQPPSPPPGLALADLPVPVIGFDVENGAIPAGTWAGESRAGFFGCQNRTSRRIVMQIVRATSGPIGRATVTFGDLPFTSSEVDPERGYPLGESFGCVGSEPLEGFPYEAMDGQLWDSGRFAFRVAPAQAYEPWCALQSSVRYDLSATGYECGPELTSDEHNRCGSADSSPCPIDKDRYSTCFACLCVADGCRANLNRTYDFELRLDGDEMSGTISLWWSEDAPIEVRLRRVD